MFSPPSSPMGSSVASVETDQVAGAMHSIGPMQRMKSSRLVMRVKRNSMTRKKKKSVAKPASTASGAWGAAMELMSIREKQQQDSAREQQINSFRQETESQLTGKGASLDQMGQLHERVAKVGDDIPVRGRRGADHLLRAAKSASPTSEQQPTRGQSIRGLFRTTSGADHHDIVSKMIPASPNSKPAPAPADLIRSLQMRTPRGLMAAPSMPPSADGMASGGPAASP